MKKKLLSLFLLALLLTTLASVASAGDYDAHNPFGSKTIYCTPNAEVGLNNYIAAYKYAHAGYLYVRHYLDGDFGSVHTNYFKAGTGRTGSTTLYGGNWMAPDTANFVRSGSIVLYDQWYAYGRGNTDYGLTTIVITGYSDSDA